MSGGSTQGLAKAGPKQAEVVRVRALKNCFLGRLYEAGEVFETARHQVVDEDGKLLPHFLLVDSKATSKRIEPQFSENPYGDPPIARQNKQES
jgi:hypothetical protein